MFSRLIRQSDFKQLDSLSYGVPDFTLAEFKTLAALFSIVEGVVVIVGEKFSLFDWLNDPVAGKDITPKVLDLGHILTDGCNLVGETFVIGTDDATMSFN